MLIIHLSVKPLKTEKGVSDLVPQSMYGIEKRKFRFPVDLHLDKAVGALTLHTGVGTIS